MKPPPNPAEFLAEALLLYVTNLKPDSQYAEPLFCHILKDCHTHLGRDVNVELMPNLVLRVCDPRTGEVLAKSKSGQIYQLDDTPPDQSERVWAAAWMEVRSMRQTRRLVVDHGTADKCHPRSMAP